MYIVEINKAGVKRQFLPPQNDFEHARTYFRLCILVLDRHYIIHAKSRLNTQVWGSLRSPNYIT